MKPRSGAITDGPSRAPARAMLKAVGFTDDDLRKPIIGIANTWIEIGPCNYHLRALAEYVKEGIRKAGGTPMEFNTVSISDGITMGSQGMKTSLVSRDLIADSIELVARGNLFDGLIALSGCDKTIPGTVMALARLIFPASCSTAARSRPASFTGDITIQDVFEAVGAHAAGRCPTPICWRGKPGVSGRRRLRRPVHREHDGDRGRVPRYLSDGLQRCAGARSRKQRIGREAGALVMDLLKRNVRPRQIITRDSIDNAIASVAATGGSTNAVLHLLAIAREVGVPLESRDVQSHQCECAVAHQPQAQRALCGDRYVQSRGRAR